MTLNGGRITLGHALPPKKAHLLFGHSQKADHRPKIRRWIAIFPIGIVQIFLGAGGAYLVISHPRRVKRPRPRHRCAEPVRQRCLSMSLSRMHQAGAKLLF
jgi:hypothetical protein